MTLGLWGSYGNIKFPQGFECDAKEDFFEVRERLAEFLKKNTDEPIALEECNEPNLEKFLKDKIKASKHKCVAVKAKNRVQYYVLNAGILGYWELWDVDTSKLWAFSEYDGSEYITYYEIKANNRLVKIQS